MAGSIDFTHNPRPTVGVELELYIVDPTTGDLVSAAGDMLAVLGRSHDQGEHPKAKHELYQSTLEIITDVCGSPAEAEADLAATLAEVQTAASDRGLILMSAGTHPFAIAREQDVSPDPRYHDLIEAMQWPARRLITCGLHVHVGVPDGESAIAVLNEVTRHLPLFLALSASSPYFEGEDSGLASARSKVFESLPTAGLPPMLAGWVDFEAFMGTLLASDCINSIREVWWDVRPHPDFGTVEFRMCDATPTLGESTALAALAQSLVAWSMDRLRHGDLPPPPREWTVRENRWLAGRYGIEGTLIVEGEGSGGPVRRPVVELVTELVDRLLPYARELDSEAELRRVLDIVDRGSGTQRQRRLVDSGASLLDVVHHLAAELADVSPART